jgi:hypothetical protein
MVGFNKSLRGFSFLSLAALREPALCDDEPKECKVLTIADA